MLNYPYNPKPIDELTFTDDGMFQAVLHEPDICAELVERLLHVQVGHVEYPEIEKQIAPYYTTKGVRLDVYLRDSDKIIDIEIQSYPQEALGKRTRYYNSLVDIDCLMKGQDYSELKDCYILFICKNDPFKDENKKPFGMSCYTFQNICKENPSVNLNDKSVKVIYNSSAYEQEKDERIKEFLKYVCTNEPGEDDFNRRLSATVEKIKENEKFRSDYAAMNLHDRDITRMAKREGIEEGRIEGAHNKAIESARNLYANGVSKDIIAKSLQMTMDELEEILRDAS